MLLLASNQSPTNYCQIARRWLEGSFSEGKQDCPAAVLRELTAAIQLCNAGNALPPSDGEGFVPRAFQLSAQVRATCLFDLANGGMIGADHAEHVGLRILKHAHGICRCKAWCRSLNWRAGPGAKTALIRRRAAASAVQARCGKCCMTPYVVS